MWTRGLSGRGFERDPSLRKRARQRVPIGPIDHGCGRARAVAHLCDAHNEHMTGSVLLMEHSARAAVVFARSGIKVAMHISPPAFQETLRVSGMLDRAALMESQYDPA